MHSQAVRLWRWCLGSLVRLKDREKWQNVVDATFGEPLARRVAIADIETFVGQNLSEMGGFDVAKVADPALAELFRLYNERSAPGSGDKRVSSHYQRRPRPRMKSRLSCLIPFPRAKRSRIMAAVKLKDTTPEMGGPQARPFPGIPLPPACSLPFPARLTLYFHDYGRSSTSMGVSGTSTIAPDAAYRRRDATTGSPKCSVTPPEISGLSESCDRAAGE